MLDGIELLQASLNDWWIHRIVQITDRNSVQVLIFSIKKRNWFDEFRSRFGRKAKTKRPWTELHSFSYFICVVHLCLFMVLKVKRKKKKWKQWLKRKVVSLKGEKKLRRTLRWCHRRRWCRSSIRDLSWTVEDALLTSKIVDFMDQKQTLFDEAFHLWLTFQSLIFLLV